MLGGGAQFVGELLPDAHFPAIEIDALPGGEVAAAEQLFQFLAELVNELGYPLVLVGFAGVADEDIVAAAGNEWHNAECILYTIDGRLQSDRWTQANDRALMRQAARARGLP
jgi:hypothetical protein